jgi:hypothetical protein
MESRGRTAALAVLFAVALAGCDGGGEQPSAKAPAHGSTGLRIERGPSGSDLVVHVRPAVNVPDRAGGRSEVVLKCVDSEGDTVLAQDEQWPFQSTDELAVGPHAHMTLDPLTITAVERCLVEGTEPLVEGQLR